MSDFKPRRLTEDERKHCEMLMAELDAWEPGMPPPEHSVDEHLEYAKKYIADIKFDARRANRHAFWLFLTWIALFLLIIFAFTRLT